LVTVVWQQNLLYPLKRAQCSLGWVSDQNFPLTSREFSVGSTSYNDYLAAFDKLAESFEESASETILVNLSVHRLQIIL
jgi:hypothetical protein